MLVLSWQAKPTERFKEKLELSVTNVSKTILVKTGLKEMF